MKHLGDITKIKGNDAPVVDVVIGGSPCQDLSLAGKRQGLSGERSGLYMEQIRIIKEMRQADAERGNTDVDIRPRYMVWENVPGAFSTNQGKDFAAVLEEVIRVAEPETPNVSVPEKGWPLSGCLLGDKWSVAWRVLDAQFWGTSSKPLPQRRRRIALIADFGGHSAPEILFVRKSVSGNLEPSEPKRKAITRDASNGSGGTGEGIPYTMKIRSGVEVDSQGKKAGKGALIQTDKSGCLNTVQDQYLFQPTVYGISPYHSNSMKSDNPHSGIYEAETSRSLDAMNCGFPGCNQGGMAVVQPMSIEHHPQDSRCNIDESGKVQTLTSRMGTGGGNVPMVLEPKTYQQVTGPLMANSHPGSYTGQDAYNDMLVASPVMCLASSSANAEITEGNISPTLCARAGTGGNNVPTVVMPQKVRYIVRRLTPLECERLQGFPDGWTDIGEWVDSKGKKHKEADSPRYKALGNSIALPPWKWVLKRLCACYERDATMASLFDGIGGFPLIWEQLNGRGSCLWASEIEEFPMAVTKLRFGDGT